MPKRKKNNNPMNDVYETSPELEEVLGVETVERRNIPGLLWIYIKKHKLQDKRDKRIIRPDETLSEVLGPNPINMFQMIKKVYKHLTLVEE